MSIADTKQMASTSDWLAPPLENGDHLSRAEFERRWEAMPQIRHAELIRGVVHMPAAVRMRHHGQAHRRLVGWIDRYIEHTPGIEGGDSASIRLSDVSMPQPDVCLYLPEKLSRSARVDEADYLDGAPEFAGEVAASSVSIDLHEKLAMYREAGVTEYLVWRVRDQAIDWFELVDGTYVLLPNDQQGVVRSRVFPGLWLDVPAMLSGNIKMVSRCLLAGCQTPEHAAFVAQLES